MRSKQEIDRISTELGCFVAVTQSNAVDCGGLAKDWLGISANMDTVKQRIAALERRCRILAQDADTESADRAARAQQRAAAAAALLDGIGKGLSAAGSAPLYRPPVSCTSFVNGNMVSTNCN